MFYFSVQEKQISTIPLKTKISVGKKNCSAIEDNRDFGYSSDVSGHLVDFFCAACCRFKQHMGQHCGI